MSLDHLRPVTTSWLRLPRRTARLRLTALYGSLFLVSGAALVAITYVLFRRATAFSKPHLPKIPHAPNIQLPPLLSKTLPQLAYDQHQLARDVSRLAETGPSRLAQFGPSQLARSGPFSQLAQDQRQLAKTVSQLTQAVHQVAQAGSLQAAQRASDSHQLLVNSGIALGIVAVLALLAAWLVAGRMLRPIRTITRAARRISSTSLHERLALGGPEDELKELGDTLDDLFERLDSAFDAQRHFVANASHELRTPITVERTLLQVALDNPDTTIAGWRSTAEEVLASNAEQERLIEALLALASGESRLDHYEAIDLSTIARAVLSLLHHHVDELGLSIDVSLAPAPLVGDPELVERLVANLLTNAVCHNIVDGRVEIVVGVKEDRAMLSVTNSGPVIPPTEIDRLFQPFQRFDPRRSHHQNGHGLGLSIVRAIATAHDADLRVSSRHDGGLEIEVTFPAGRPAPEPDKVGAR